jgi:hypothetical protein
MDDEGDEPENKRTYRRIVKSHVGISESCSSEELGRTYVVEPRSEQGEVGKTFLWPEQKRVEWVCLVKELTTNKDDQASSCKKGHNGDPEDHYRMREQYVVFQRLAS